LKAIDPLLLFDACSLYGCHGVVEWHEHSPSIRSLRQGHVRVAGPQAIDKTLDLPISPAYAPRQIGNDNGGKAGHHERGCIQLRVCDQLNQ
jgi:hypothetical protein